MIQIEPYKLAGYYTYISSYLDLNLPEVQWLIPEELVGNSIVLDKMHIQPFEKLLENISAIENYNYILSTKYLDIEREPLIASKNNMKRACYTILEEINKNLSPYHWEMQENRNDNLRCCLLIGLFKGENRLSNNIKTL